jgi:hypothetical protein
MENRRNNSNWLQRKRFLSGSSELPLGWNDGTEKMFTLEELEAL